MIYVILRHHFKSLLSLSEAMLEITTSFPLILNIITINVSSYAMLLDTITSWRQNYWHYKNDISLSSQQGNLEHTDL